MARFNYTAEKPDGEIYTGVADAKDRFELYSIVRKEGGHIVSIAEESGNKWLSLSYLNSKFGSVKEYDKILLARNLGAMLSAGLALARALAVLERQTKNPKLRNVIGEVASSVRRGDTLHDALSKFPNVFSNLFVAMVRAGEEGGTLPDALSVVSEQMERMYQLKKKIKSAMIYPCIIIIAIIGIGVLMMIKVVPTLAQTFREVNAELPPSTQFVIGVSDFLVQYTVVAIGLAGGALALFYFALRTPIGRRTLDFVILHLPLISPMVREVNAARTSRTLASLLSSGVDVIASLEITGQVVQNHYFKGVIDDAKRGVGQGEPLSAAFVRREDLYPPFVGEMMSVGEETGALSEMLKRLAVFYEDEVDRKTKDMSTIVEPFLMVIIGLAVGFFAVSMITPIYSLSQSIG
ncbi:MAG: type II secretion system F family protein [Candidatus Kaiserbacteria bacterium]|nr:MAG: type II secretion system F family protein [Candidatus Kaiserbacteria bacterium]